MRKPAAIRSGLSLTEVMISLVIFALYCPAIGQLFSAGSDRALVAKLKQEGVFFCQSKLAEYEAGIEAMQSQSGAAFDVTQDPTGLWTWSSSCEQLQPEEPILWRVQVQMQRQRQLGNPVLVTMTKFILDPASRGSSLDPAPPPALEEEGESTDGTTNQGG